MGSVCKWLRRGQTASCQNVEKESLKNGGNGSVSGLKADFECDEPSEKWASPRGSAQRGASKALVKNCPLSISASLK